MEDNKVKLAEKIKSIITDSHLFENVKSELNENMYKAVIVITPQNGIQVRVKVDIPQWDSRHRIHLLAVGTL